MTQFLLVDQLPGKESASLRPLSDQEFIQKASADLFGPRTAAFELNKDGDTFDSVYSRAQTEMAEGCDPEATDLLCLLRGVKPCAKAMALFYADDYTNLPTTSDWDAFISELLRDLRDMSPCGTSRMWISE